MSDHPAPRTLGAILADGRSRRFGATKALAPLAGAPLVRHVARALAQAVDEAVVITASAEVAAAAGLRALPDTVAGAGPLAGLHAALLRAAEGGLDGALAVACDTPFLPHALLRAVVSAARRAGAPALAAEGPDGPEPLCAWYSVELVGAVEHRLHQRDRGLHRLLVDVGAAALPLADVRRHADPAVCFLNLNTREELSRAERIHAQA